MSKVETRFPYAQVFPLAQELANAVADLSPSVHIAGSIRRQREDVGDVDLVVLDRGENPWLHSQVAARVGLLGYAQTKDGEKIARFAMPGQPSLDIYYAMPGTWGITLLVRTGSAGHNIKMVQLAGRCTPARNFAVSRGIVDTAGNVVAGEDEHGIFAALGLKYVEPEDREAPEFDYMVGAE